MVIQTFLRSGVSLSFAVVVVTVGCVHDRHSPTEPSTEATFQVQGPGPEPLCQLGCVDIDPDPSAPGVFLGHAINPDYCFPGSDDSDRDGVSDYCEKLLAQAFAPQLYYSSVDDVSREPHWAARAAGGERGTIIYLLSYHRDNGSSAWGCGLPGAPASCHGHNGDSEWIELTVRYDWGTEHWVLDSAGYSQHGGQGAYFAGPSGYPALFYPEHPGSYPRAYVSEGKHANYATIKECNRGGTLGTDTCQSVNTAARDVPGLYQNIGSRAVHSANQDCMQSSDPTFEYYGSGAIECYWTELGAFRGWIPTWIGGASARSYTAILLDRGF